MFVPHLSLTIYMKCLVIIFGSAQISKYSLSQSLWCKESYKFTWLHQVCYPPPHCTTRVSTNWSLKPVWLYNDFHFYYHTVTFLNLAYCIQIFTSCTSLKNPSHTHVVILCNWLACAYVFDVLFPHLFFFVLSNFNWFTVHFHITWRVWGHHCAYQPAYGFRFCNILRTCCSFGIWREPAPLCIVMGFVSLWCCGCC